MLDGFSRYIIAWKLYATMKASDVTETLTMALAEDKRMDHVRGAPLHPQTQGKIERWHQTLKNRILLGNYYLPGDLGQKIGDFVACYNHLRYHESSNYLTTDIGGMLGRTTAV